MSKTKKQVDCVPAQTAGYYQGVKEQAKLLAATSDEEIGKAYRLLKENRDFLNARGIYV